jgi:phosphatidate cytidylyltransferase
MASRWLVIVLLKQRIITGLLMAALFICSLLALPKFVFVLLISLLLLIGAWEWSNLAHLCRPIQRFTYVFITVLLLSIFAFFAGIPHYLTINVEVIRYLLLISVSWWALALLWVQGYPSSAVFAQLC